MVLAAAGRRIDPADALTARFPLRNADLVRRRIRALFESHQATALVTSGACGADLIALDEAGALGLRRRVILPFDRNRFRATSVTDRPGDWGPLYDRLMDEIASRQDLIILSGAAEENAAYAAVNSRILDEAEALARLSTCGAAAVLLWDGRPRGDNDLTKAFGDCAHQRGLTVLGVSTLDEMEDSCLEPTRTR
jgi:hypothetical protein